MSDVIARIDGHPIFGFLIVTLETHIGLGYDHPRAINVTEHDPGGPAFYELPTVYPATVTQARYGGSYEGAQWLAFPCYPHQLHTLCPGWDDSDVECAEFWGTARADSQRWPIGRSETPSGAYDDLVTRVEAAAAFYNHADDNETPAS